ncbi:hypothetical protein [Rossellomorea vietnamensis]|uniref:hypothetical protein n=1 Tax=Rossellomorea vietnamensis TaxID=218284 RepID=UPI00165367C4|nr:hypothetical protein [Rossellomorea vietnamensis]
MSEKHEIGDMYKKYPAYRVGEVVFTEVKIVEVDDDLDDVKVKIGTTEIWLKQSQIKHK